MKSGIKSRSRDDSSFTAFSWSYPPVYAAEFFVAVLKVELSFQSPPNIIGEITSSKNQEDKSHDEPVITVESVTTLDQKLIDSENNILEKREIHDENEVNEINFLER